ncbi:uncharacterized protein LOC142321751 [Lycorma delicatula]|uniref:uncharacterized protein LOC142321751 n=1 Tax=Lycorma delicatula TaxID=130591 RepID=UPI003F51ABAC
MYKVTSVKKLRELLEEERKSRKQKEDEVLKFKSELERKNRLLSTYKNLSAVSHLAVVEARNSNAVPVMVLREDELRQQLEFNIKRLKESEKKCEELVARLEEVNRFYETANNGVINQQLLVQQLEALNVEKSNEIKQLQKIVNESKMKRDNGTLTIQPRYVSSLKNAIAFGELLLEKNVPLPKQKKHWISNAQIWLEQIGEKKIKIDIKEKTDDKEAGDCNDSSSENFEEFQSSAESVKSSVMPLQKSNDSINSPTSWSDEGVGLSPQLSVISTSSSFSERTTFSCSSRDSGIADCNKSTAYNNNSVNTNNINYSSDHNKLMSPKSVDQLFEKENNSNNDSKKEDCLSSSDVSVTLAEQKPDSLKSFKPASPVEKPQVLFNDLKSIFDPVLVCEDKKLSVEKTLGKCSEKEESKPMKKDIEIKGEAEIEINCLHNNVGEVECTDVTDGFLGFESIHDTSTNSLLKINKTDANKSTGEGDISNNRSISLLPQSSIGIINDNESATEAISSSFEVSKSAVLCEENTSSFDKGVITNPVSVSDLSVLIDQDINMVLRNKESLDSDSHHFNSDTLYKVNADLKCNIDRICKDLAVVYSTELIDNTGTIEILKCPKLNKLSVVKIKKFQQEIDKFEKHCDHHYSINCCSKNKTECKSPKKLCNDQLVKNVEDVVCSEITPVECFEVSKFDDKHEKHMDSNSFDVISMSTNNCDAVSSLDGISTSEEKNNNLNVTLFSPNKRNSADTLISSNSSDACEALFTDKNVHIVDAESRIVEESSECLLVNSEVNSVTENLECFSDINSYNNVDCIVTDKIEGSNTDLELDLVKGSDIKLADDKSNKNNGTEILVHEIGGYNLLADTGNEQVKIDSDYIVSNVSEPNVNPVVTEVDVMEEDSVSLNCMSESSNDCTEDDDDMEELFCEIKDITSFCNIRMLSPMSPVKGKMGIQCNPRLNVENLLDGTLEFPHGKTENCTLNSSSATLITAAVCTDEEKLSVDDDHDDAVLKRIFNDVFCPSPLSSPTDGSDISSPESILVNKNIDSKSFSNVKVVNENNITEILQENANLNETEQNALRNDLTVSDDKEICLKNKQTNDLFSVNENNKDSSEKQNDFNNDLSVRIDREIYLKNKQINGLCSVNKNNESNLERQSKASENSVLSKCTDPAIEIKQKCIERTSSYFLSKNDEFQNIKDLARKRHTLLDEEEEADYFNITVFEKYFQLLASSSYNGRVKNRSNENGLLTSENYCCVEEKCDKLFSKQNNKDLDNSIIKNSDVLTVTSSQNTLNHNEYISEYANKLEVINTDQSKSIASVCPKSPAKLDDSEISSQVRRSSRLYLKSLKNEPDSVSLENKENISKKNELCNSKPLKQESKDDISKKNRNLSRTNKKEICKVSAKFVDLKELPTSDLDLSQLTNKPCNRISCRSREKLSKLDRSRRKSSRFSRNNSHQYCTYCCKDSVDKKDSLRESCGSLIESELTENIILKHSGDVSISNKELLDEGIVTGVSSTLHEGVIPESTSKVFTTCKDHFDGVCKSVINLRTSSSEIGNKGTCNKSKIMKRNCIKNKERVAVNNINKKETESGHSGERCQQDDVISNPLENAITSENEKVVNSSDKIAKDGILKSYLLKPPTTPVISQLPDAKHKEIEKHNFPNTDSSKQKCSTVQESKQKCSTVSFNPQIKSNCVDLKSTTVPLGSLKTSEADLYCMKNPLQNCKELPSNSMSEKLKKLPSVSVKTVSFYSKLQNKNEFSECSGFRFGNKSSMNSEVASNMEEDKPVASKLLTSDSVLQPKSKVKRMQFSTSEAPKSVNSLKHLFKMRNKCNIKKQPTFAVNNNCIIKDPVITPSERKAQIFKNNISESKYELKQSIASGDNHISNFSSNHHCKLPDLMSQSNKYLHSIPSNETKPKCMTKVLPDLSKDKFSEIISKNDDAKNLKSVTMSNDISVTVPSSVYSLTPAIDFRQSLNKQRYSQININDVKSGSLLQKNVLPEDPLKLPSHSEVERSQISTNGQVLSQSLEVGHIISPLTHSSQNVFLEESGHNIKSDIIMNNDSCAVYPNFYTSNNILKKRKLNESVEDDTSDSKKRPKIHQEISDVDIEKEKANLLETNVETDYRDIRFIEEKVNCESNIIDAALNYHKNSLLALTEAEALEEKKKEGKDVKLAESVLEAVQKSACEDKPVTKEFLDQTIKKLKVCGPKSIAEMIIDLLCVDNGNVDHTLSPSLTPIQQYLFPVAHNLCNSDDYQDFLHVFLLSVKTTLFSSTDVCMVEPSKCLTRFSTLLCRSLGAVEEMRWFMYDVLYMLRFKSLPIIFTMLTHWPDLLPHSDAGKDCPLTFCISHVINNQSVDKQHTPLYKGYGLKLLLKRVYNYKFGEMSSEQVFEKLLSMIANKGFIDAVILLCKREGCSWTTEKVIKKSFLPMLESWRKGNIDDDKAAVIIITLGYILRPFPQDVAGEVTHEVLCELDRILSDKEGRPVVQEAAAISACHLSRSDFSACVNMLRKWTPKNGEVSRNVIETMKYFICKKKPVWWQKVLSGCIKIPDVLVL